MINTAVKGRLFIKMVIQLKAHLKKDLFMVKYLTDIKLLNGLIQIIYLQNKVKDDW